jgi:hypothetical protein
MSAWDHGHPPDLRGERMGGVLDHGTLCSCAMAAISAARPDARPATRETMARVFGVMAPEEEPRIEVLRAALHVHEHGPGAGVEDRLRRSRRTCTGWSRPHPLRPRRRDERHEAAAVQDETATPWSGPRSAAAWLPKDSLRRRRHVGGDAASSSFTRVPVVSHPERSTAATASSSL